jgi:(2Fe-2S) ferredoxin
MSTRTLERRRRRAATRWAALAASPRPVVYIGMGSCGLAAGAAAVLAAVRAHLAERAIDAEIVSVGCIGPCYLEPIFDVQLPGRPRVSYSNMTAELAVKTLDALLAGEAPRRHLIGRFDAADGDGHFAPGDADLAGLPRFLDHAMLRHQTRIVLRNCGVIDPEQLDHYLARGGYRAFESCLEMPWSDVIETVKASGLRGRGGAGFPTWLKWSKCREIDNDARNLICNADEGDPGAFMNRSLIEGDPHALLEGMLIAAYAIGAAHGYIYIRAEYPLAVRGHRGHE